MMTKEAADAPLRSDEIDLRELLGVLIDRKWLIAGITAAFLVLAAVYVMVATPIYRANTIVQVEARIPSLPGMPDLAEIGVGGASTTATTEIALITSRTVIGNAAEALGLDVTVEPHRLPLLGDLLARRFRPATPGDVAAPRFGLSRYGWGGERLEIFQLEVPDALVGRELTLIAGADGTYGLYDEDRLLLNGRVGETAREGETMLAVETLHAHPGTRFSVRKRSRLAVIAPLQGQVNVVEMGRASGILQLLYEHEDPGFAQTFLQHVADAYVRQNVERNSAQASSQLEFVREQLPGVRRQVDAAQDALNAYQTSANSVDINMQTKGLLDQEVAVESSIQQLRLRQVEMDRSFTRAHPAYRALLRQIDELEARKQGFQRQVGELPDTQQELLRLTRDLRVSDALYTELLNQAQQLDVARAGTVGNVRVIDPAVVGSTPVKPRKALILLIATAFGGFIAVGVVFLQRILNPGIEDPAQIEELGLPVYAAIPLSDAKDLAELRKQRRGDGRQHLLALNNPADLAVEALRSLRTSLHFAMLDAKNNILTVCGSRPEVGKTFVTANLAAAIAQADQRVLVIDGDLRKGALHKLLGVSPTDGLSDVLAGKIAADDAIHALSGLENLHYLVRGATPPNPSELLMHPRFTKLLETLAPRYDLVVIDTPPILAVTDAGIVARHAGTNLLVTRFGMNQPKEVQLTMKRFEQNGVHLKGAIFNAVERRSAGYHSYGYYEYTSSTG